MIIVVCISGAILVFTTQLNRALHPELWDVQPGAQRLGPDSVLALARSAHADLNAVALSMPRDPTHPWTVRLQGGLMVYVDPYRGRILGDHDERRSFTGVVEGLHTALLVGKPGLWAVVGSTIVLIVMLLTGYVLWWPRTKKESRRSFTIQWRAGWKRFNYDGHNVIGFYASGYLLLIALTGVLLSFPIFTRAVYRLTGAERPSGPPRSAVVADSAIPITLGEAVRVAKGTDDGWEAGSISVPTRRRQAIRVGLQRSGGEGPGRRVVFVDQFSGERIRVDRPEDRSAVAKVLALSFPIHSGNVLGWPTKIAAFVVSMVGGILPLTGVIIWYPRWRAKRRRRRA